LRRCGSSWATAPSARPRSMCTSPGGGWRRRPGRCRTCWGSFPDSGRMGEARGDLRSRLEAAASKGRAAALAAWKNRGLVPEDGFRSFPWRVNPSPYQVLLAELLLRKTTAAQVRSLYPELLKRYPDACSLARASKQDLVSLLRPLGLLSRADLMLGIAEFICQECGGEVPCDRKKLETLKGAGPYIAGAVLSFGCKQREPVVDTGIARLWNRVTGGAIRRRHSPHRDPAAWAASRAYIGVYPGSPDEGNYVLLDVARLVCRPSRPQCRHCPFQEVCEFARYWGAG